MTDITNPEETDVEVDDIFEEETPTDTGSKDVVGKDEVANLTLEELNAVSGRKFESKEDYLKHYENLKKLVGDQDLAKKRKEKEVVEKAPDKVSELEKKVAEMEKESIKKDFILETPTAKEHLDLIEAYAEKHGMSLSEAWTSKFANLVESSQSKNVINKNRINPVQSQRTSDLAKLARQGDERAQNELINELVWRK